MSLTISSEVVKVSRVRAASAWELAPRDKGQFSFIHRAAERVVLLGNRASGIADSRKLVFTSDRYGCEEYPVDGGDLGFSGLFLHVSLLWRGQHVEQVEVR